MTIHTCAPHSWNWRRLAWTGLLLIALVLPCPADGDETDSAAGIEFFENRIRPVLVQHCYECHSLQAKEVKGDLLVDSATGIRQGGDSGPALVPGDADASLLLAAMRYEGMEMPPAGRLPEATVQDFERWIAMGAPDPRSGPAVTAMRPAIDIEAGRQFWAFRPVQDPLPPAVSPGDWPWDPLDAFVLAGLDEHGLRPSADSPRSALVRRLYYDLIGLPPTAADVQSFVAESAQDPRGAVEALVDRLLDSPQFGVHWGRHWLDVARYADSNGGDFNATFHDAWRYRDYVVRAFNEDKPFDQFVREQIAGDLLAFDSDAQHGEQIVATGFLMVGTKMLSERDKEKLRMDVVDEQIDSLGRVFLGLTLGCARCHDHKFDPIPTRDYYALAGIFRSTSALEGESQQYVSTWPRRALPAASEHVAAVQRHQAEQNETVAELDAAKKTLTQAQRALEMLTVAENRLTVDDADAELIGVWKASTHSSPFVGKGYIHDDRSEKGEKWATFRVSVAKAGRYDVRVAYTPGGGRDKRVPVVIHHAGGETEVFLNQQPKPSHDGLFASVGQFAFQTGQIAAVTISNRDTQGHVIADAVQLVEVDEAGQPVRTDVAVATDKADAAQAAVAQRQAEVTELEQRLKQLEANAPPPLPTALAVVDHAEIGDCEIRIRGEYRNLGATVPRGFVQVVGRGGPPTLPADASGRRELAEWIADPANPLTSRVLVNRIWAHLIGEGIVRSVDNFGELGERPTHPELLDHLASDLMREGWSVKHIIRRILLSRTYQLGSLHDEAAWQADPENRWLWRAHRRRLPAEAVRDAMLAISGQLDLEPGGSPVEGLGVLVTNNDADAEDYQRQESRKRSLYLPIIRNELPPILAVFDFADPDLVTGKRAVTNVPAQALLLMNSPFVMNCAERAAERLAAGEFANHRELVAELYWQMFSREPAADELDRAINFLVAESAGDATAPPAAGQTTADPTSRQELAPLARLTHVLFAATEFRVLE